MDLKTASGVLKVERNQTISKIKAIRKLGIKYWMDERDRNDARLEELVKEFNEVIARRKVAVKNLAACQSDHRKMMDYIDKLDQAIEILEDLED